MDPARAGTQQHQQRKETLVTLLRQATNQLVEELVTRLAAAGYADIRPAHSRVFENIDSDGTRITELAKRARMMQPSMSELVADLEGRGYLERRVDPTDGRARLVCLTSKGRAVQRLALRELAEIERAWLARLGPELGGELPGALRRVVDEEDGAG